MGLLANALYLSLDCNTGVEYWRGHTLTFCQYPVVSLITPHPPHFSRKSSIFLKQALFLPWYWIFNPYYNILHKTSHFFFPFFICFHWNNVSNLCFKRIHMGNSAVGQLWDFLVIALQRSIVFCVKTLMSHGSILLSCYYCEC